MELSKLRRSHPTGTGGEASADRSLASPSPASISIRSRFNSARRAGKAEHLERAGVSRSDAMKMVGHKTEAIYRRYAISDERSMKEAAGKLDQFYVIDQQPTQTST